MVQLTEQLEKEIDKMSGKEATDDDRARESICILAEELDQSLHQMQSSLKLIEEGFNKSNEMTSKQSDNPISKVRLKIIFLFHLFGCNFFCRSSVS